MVFCPRRSAISFQNLLLVLNRNCSSSIPATPMMIATGFIILGGNYLIPLSLAGISDMVIRVFDSQPHAGSHIIQFTIGRDKNERR